MDLGWTLGADLILVKTEYFNLGFGYELQLSRNLENSPEAIAFNSYYGIIEINSSNGVIWFGRIGTGDFIGNDDFTSNGLFKLSRDTFLNFGGKYKISENIFIELSESYIQGDVDFDNISMWTEYKTYNISIGHLIQ